MVANDIDYEEYDVAEDAYAREEMRKKSGQLGVPVIVVNDEVIIGFDQAVLNEALGLCVPETN